MRVTILGRDFPPTIGGIADYTDLVATELAKRGVAVSVVCAPPAERRASFEVVESVDRWDAAGVPSIVRAVQDTAPEAILWQYNPFNLGRHGVALRAAPMLAKRLSRVARLVVVAHELWFPWGRGGARGLVWAAAQRIETRAVLRRARTVVVTTPARERALAKFDPVRIPVGTNVEPRPAERDMRAALEIPRESFLIAHFGTAGPGKDLAPAFSALRELSGHGIDARLVLAGKGSDAAVPEDLQERVRVTGVISRAAISALLQAADCYLHPDRSGPSVGRRGSLVAAIAHATPVVAYDGPDRDPGLADGENILIAHPDALTNALMRLRDPDVARRIGRNGRHLFDKTYSWTRIGDSLMGVLLNRR
jgi:glycosyltransferase involved in cell wall biosynthesis